MCVCVRVCVYTHVCEGSIDKNACVETMILGDITLAFDIGSLFSQEFP